MSQTRNTTLQDLLARFRESMVADLHTALPGKIVKYDESTQKADVQPLIKERFVDEGGAQQVRDLPVIPSVPVQFPGAGGYRITFPVVVGDTGLMVFSEASLDKWLVSGGTVDPADERRHDLTDAVFLPGLRDFGHALSSAPTDRATFGKDGGLQIHIDGSKIRIGSNSPIDLEKAVCGDTLWNYLTSLTGLVVWLASHTHPTPAGASSAPTTPPPSPTDFRSSVVEVKK
jgi:hypothetical protein